MYICFNVLRKYIKKDIEIIKITCITDKRSALATLPNECSSPDKDNEYTTRRGPSGINIKVLFSRPTNSYSRCLAKGIVRIFEGEYWRMSLKRTESSTSWDQSSCESLQSTFANLVPKFYHERRHSQWLVWYAAINQSLPPNVTDVAWITSKVCRLAHLAPHIATPTWAS